MRPPFLYGIIVAVIFLLLIIFTTLLFQIRTEEEAGRVPEKHFALVAGNVNQPLWTDIYEGALQYAGQNNLSVELFGPRHFDLQEHIRWMKIAVACRLDGLIFPAYADDPYTDLIAAVKEQGIPAVTVMYDLPGSGRDSYVGIDPVALGNAATLLIDHATGGLADIAVIRNSLFEGERDLKETDPVIRGILQAVEEEEGLHIARIESSPYGIFSTEEISRDILLHQRNVNAFFCDSVNSTLGVTQMVVDLNRVGEVAIVGFMRNDDIDRYLANNIISGVIHTDSYEMGRNAAAILHDLSEGRQASSFVKIGFSLLFSPGLEETLAERSE